MEVKGASVQGQWTVQVNAFPHERDARDLAKKLSDRGYDAYVVPVEIKGRPWYRVRVGRLATREEAKELQETMKSKENLTQAIAVTR
jgi:DedD protein